MASKLGDRLKAKAREHRVLPNVARFEPRASTGPRCQRVLCRKEFVPTRDHQIFCCPACRVRDWKERNPGGKVARVADNVKRR